MTVNSTEATTLNAELRERMEAYIKRHPSTPKTAIIREALKLFLEADERLYTAPLTSEADNERT